MDRLTKRGEFGISRVCHYPDKDGDALLVGDCYGCTHRTKCNADIMERLAMYEDIAEQAERKLSEWNSRYQKANKCG